jgi:hypothetical protein
VRLWLSGPRILGICPGISFALSELSRSRPSPRRQDIPTVETIRDKASAIVELYKKQHDRAAEDAMAKVRLRAERKIGELTKQMQRASQDHGNQYRRKRGGIAKSA